MIFLVFRRILRPLVSVCLIASLSASDAREPFFIPNLSYVCQHSSYMGIVSWDVSALPNSVEPGHPERYQCHISPIVTIFGILPKDNVILGPCLNSAQWTAMSWRWIVHVPQAGSHAFLALEGDPPLPFDIGSDRILRDRISSCENPSAIGSNIEILNGSSESETTAGIVKAVSDMKLSLGDEIIVYYKSTNLCERRLIAGDLFERYQNDKSVKISNIITTELLNDDEPLDVRYLAANRAIGPVDDVSTVLAALIKVGVDIHVDGSLRARCLDAVAKQILISPDKSFLKELRTEVSRADFNSCDKVRNKYEILYNGSHYRAPKADAAIQSAKESILKVINDH